MRQRIIFQGVREDLDVMPAFPSPLPYRYSVREAIPWITATLHYGQFENYTGERESLPAQSGPCPTILATQGGSQQFHVEAECDISRYAIGREWDKIGVGGKSDKYTQLTRPNPDKPSGTITAEGGNTSLASVTHPTERRKFSIAELKRICGFPDDFVLTGSYAQQWERLGRAVPPVMMYHIAKTLRDEVLCRIT